MKELITELGLEKMDFHHDDLFRELQNLVKVDDEQSNRKSVKIFLLIFFPQRCLWNNLPYLQQTSHYGQGHGLSTNGKDGFLRGNRRKY